MASRGAANFVVGLPAELPAAVLIVLHRPATAVRAMPVTLDRAGPLRAVSTSDSGPAQSGQVTVAPTKSASELQSELELTNRQLEAAYEGLPSTSKG